MRQGVTFNLGGPFQTQEHPPHQHHLSPPPAAAMGWKSPVPYLFGGLAAMLGLIAFALLILACSYWKLSGYLDAGEDSGEFSGDVKPKDVANGTPSKCQNSILVIMAGEQNPTFVATPATSKATSLPSDSEGGNKGSCSNCGGSNSNEENRREKVVATTTTTTTTTTATATTTTRIDTNCDEEEKS